MKSGPSPPRRLPPLALSAANWSRPTGRAVSHSRLRRFALLGLAGDQSVSGVKTLRQPAFGSRLRRIPTTRRTKPTSMLPRAEGGNLSSPPPIGNVTPNTGNFTTLTVQTDQRHSESGALSPARSLRPDQRRHRRAYPHKVGRSTPAALRPTKLVTPASMQQAGDASFSARASGPSAATPESTSPLPTSSSPVPQPRRFQPSTTTLTSGTAAPLIANFADPVANNGNYPHRRRHCSSETAP